MKPAPHEKRTSPYNSLKQHMTKDLVKLVYGSIHAPPPPPMGGSTAGAGTAADGVVSSVSRQLAEQRVGVVTVDCDATLDPASTATAEVGWVPNPKGRHDRCVGEDFLEYLLRSEREYTDRGGFLRIYPMVPALAASSATTVTGALAVAAEKDKALDDAAGLLLRYIGQANPGLKGAGEGEGEGGREEGATTWMLHALLSRIEGGREPRVAASTEPSWYGAAAAAAAAGAPTAGGGGGGGRIGER